MKIFKKVLFLGLSLTLIYATGLKVSAATVVMDNDGQARSTPYGDSGLPNSYKDLGYYDCYLPYNLTIGDIGGYADGVRAYKHKDYNFSMSSAHSSLIGKTFTPNVMREFTRSGKTFKNCRISTEADTGMDVITDANGNQYYLTAIQGFFYNFGGLATVDGTSFPGFSSVNRGQVFDVILTDGTCLHFVVGDANAIGHTNGGESTTQDVTYSFASLKLPQYKNLFQAANGNCLELWGNKDCTSSFKNKYNLKEDGVKIAYYRMYNSFVDKAPVRADSVGTGVSYSMGTTTIGGSGSSHGGNNPNKLVSEWELEGMPTLSELKAKQLSLYLPDRSDLTIKEASAVVLLGKNISLEKSASAFDTARIVIVFLGICITSYAIFIFVAMIFDLVNSFIDIDLVKTLTFGAIRYMPKDVDYEESKNVYSTKKLIVSNSVIIMVGIVLLSGGVLPFMGNIVFGVSQKFL